MSLPSFRTKTITCRGGLDLETDPLMLSAGALILCKNFECKVDGGYRRSGAFERHDGQPSPSDADDPVAARALIAEVPGSGPVRGLWLYQGTLYAFRDSVDGTEAMMYASTATGWSRVSTGTIVLAPGGRFEFRNYNFSGAAYTEKMYGVDGKNDLFSFDGTNFVQLPVAGFTSKPKHLAVHKNRAFLAFPLGQLVASAVGDPSDYDTSTSSAVLIATGGEIVGLKTTVGGALSVFMRNRISILYGSTTADFQAQDLREQSEKAGAIEWTIQEVGDTIYLDDRGLTSLSQTDKFGNFENATIDAAIRDYLKSRFPKIIDSTISREKNQYRLFIEFQTGTEMISLAFGDNGLEGYGRSVYAFRVSTAVSEEDSAGRERVFVGSESGMVYEIDKGVSADGADIEAYLKLSFHHYGSPDYRKRFRRAIVGIEAREEITLKIKPEFNYGSTDSPSHQLREQDVLGGGGQWGLDEWSDFIWSSPVVGKAEADIGGAGENMALLFYHKGQAEAFTIYNVIVHYMNRRLAR